MHEDFIMPSRGVAIFSHPCFMVTELTKIVTEVTFYVSL